MIDSLFDWFKSVAVWFTAQNTSTILLFDSMFLLISVALINLYYSNNSK